MMKKINLITDFAYFCECIGTPTNNVLDLQASILAVFGYDSMEFFFTFDH